jgi:hypothetical protein
LEVVKTMNNNWMYKRMQDYTLEDALQAFDEGFFCICKDGRVRCLTNAEDNI